MAEGGSAAYYRLKVNNGNWSSTSTWEASTDSGSSWSAATGVPGDTSGVRDTVYSLQSYTVLYDMNMTGEVTFGSGVSNGSVVLPDADPGSDLQLKGGVMRRLNFDLDSKSWTRKVYIENDNEIWYSTFVGKSRATVVYKILAVNSGTELVVRPFDMESKAELTGTGSDIVAGDLLVYDNSNTASITAVTWDSGNNKYTVTLDASITAVADDYCGIKDENLKIHNNKLSNYNFILSKAENIIYETSVEGSSVYATQVTQYVSRITNSVLIINCRGEYFATNKCFITQDFGASTYTTYLFLFALNSFINITTSQYYVGVPFYSINSILRKYTQLKGGILLKNTEYINSASFYTYFYYNHIVMIKNLRGLSSFSFPLNTHPRPIKIERINIGSDVYDYILYYRDGYLQRKRANGYWEAIGEAWYYFEADTQAGAITSPFCFYHQNSAGGTGTIKIYVDGVKEKEENFTLSSTKALKCVSETVAENKNVQVYIKVPDGTYLWTDGLESILGGLEKGLVSIGI